MAFRDRVVEPSTAGFMNSIIAGLCLPASDDGVDVERIDLEAIAAPANALRGHQRAAAPHKRIEDEITAGGAVEDRIGNKFDGLHRRMQRQQVAFLGAASQRVGARVVPDIAAVATEAAELHVVTMGRVAIFE